MLHVKSPSPGSQWIVGFPVVSSLLVFSALTVIAGPKGAIGDLYVVNSGKGTIIQVDPTTGTIVGDFVSGLSVPKDACFGPNGNLFVVNAGNNVITEYDGQTGNFIGIFANTNMNLPQGLVFAPNGHLLVSNTTTSNITEYDATGTYLGVFASSVTTDNTPIHFGPDGNLYVSTFKGFGSGTIVRFAPDGTSMGPFAKGGLKFPEGTIFEGTNGNLFVANRNKGSIDEFDGVTGASLGTFAKTHMSWPEGIVFDMEGNLWVANNTSKSISEFDGTTGVFIRQIKGFSSPIGITIKPKTTDCLAMTVSTLIAGQNASWDISVVLPNSRIVVVFGSKAGETILNGEFGYCSTFGIDGIGVNNVVGTALADDNGNASITKNIPGNASGLTVLTQASEQFTCPDECMSNVDTQVVQ